jgi:hypothetical protein
MRRWKALVTGEYVASWYMILIGEASTMQGSVGSYAQKVWNYADSVAGQICRVLQGPKQVPRAVCFQILD